MGENVGAQRKLSVEVGGTRGRGKVARGVSKDFVIRRWRSRTKSDMSIQWNTEQERSDKTRGRSGRKTVVDVEEDDKLTKSRSARNWVSHRLGGTEPEKAWGGLRRPFEAPSVQPSRSEMAGSGPGKDR